jgi:hypothetical protein
MVGRGVKKAFKQPIRKTWDDLTDTENWKDVGREVGKTNPKDTTDAIADVGRNLGGRIKAAYKGFKDPEGSSRDEEPSPGPEPESNREEEPAPEPEPEVVPEPAAANDPDEWIKDYELPDPPVDDPDPEPVRIDHLHRKARDIEKRLHKLSLSKTADPRELEKLYIKLDTVKNDLKRRLGIDQGTPLPESRIFQKRRLLQAIHGTG